MARRTLRQAGAGRAERMLGRTRRRRTADARQCGAPADAGATARIVAWRAAERNCTRWLLVFFRLAMDERFDD